MTNELVCLLIFSQYVTYFNIEIIIASIQCRNQFV